MKFLLYAFCALFTRKLFWFTCSLVSTYLSYLHHDYRTLKFPLICFSLLVFCIFIPKSIRDYYWAKFMEV